MDKLVRDLRHAVRMLLKTPVFTSVVVFTLAVGIGANTAMFSIVNGVLLQGLPFQHAERIVDLNEVERRDIKIGTVDDNGVTIAEGLSGSERVVLSAGPFLNPGQKVNPRRQAAR